MLFEVLKKTDYNGCGGEEEGVPFLFKAIPETLLR
jgi:hypothetical protein